MFEGITRKLDISRNAHFLGNSGAVSADGFLTEGEFGGYLFNSHAPRDHPQDLQFADGEAVVRGLFEVAAERGCEFFGQRSSDVPPAGEGFSCSREKFVGGAALIQVA